MYWQTAGRRDAFKAHMTDEHLGFEEVGEIAAKAHVKSVVLYHWNPALRVTAHSRAP